VDNLPSSHVYLRVTDPSVTLENLPKELVEE